MGSSNRVQIAAVREVTPGTTPTTPRMRLVRATGESLDFSPDFVDDDELREDRMTIEPTQVGQAAKGGLNGTLSFPDDNSPTSDQWRSTFQSAWNNINSRDNDGTADSVITGIAVTNEVVTVLTGTAFVAKELYRFSGMGVTLNNGVFKCSQGSATVPRFIGAGLTDEPAPPAAARIQCVGMIGDSGDINATATGLSSTATDFTTIPGLVKGKWVKLGGTGAGNRFVTSANNDWVRISDTPTATALPLDNLPSGWATETGTGLTIKIWFGDYIRNGVTPTAVTLEKGFLDQGTPTYIVNKGMQVNTHGLQLTKKQKITQTVEYLGMSGGEGVTALDASPDARTTGLVMSGSAHVGRMNEGGSRLTSPNWAESLKINFTNNLRAVEAVDEMSPVQINPGDFGAGGEINTQFGSRALLTKYYNATTTSLSTKIARTSNSVPQALVFTFPKVTLRGGGNPQAGGKNQDVMANFQWSASIDTATDCMAQMDRVPYFED